MKNPWLIASVVLGIGFALLLGLLIGQNQPINKKADENRLFYTFHFNGIMWTIDTKQYGTAISVKFFFIIVLLYVNTLAVCMC